MSEYEFYEHGTEQHYNDLKSAMEDLSDEFDTDMFNEVIVRSWYSLVNEIEKSLEKIHELDDKIRSLEEANDG